VLQRQPLASAVRVEARNVQHAIVEEVEVRLTVARVVAPVRDELVDILAACIVAGVRHNLTAGRDHNRRRLVAEAPQPGALHRHRVGIVGVELDDPAEAEPFIRFFGDIEAIIEVLPPALGCASRHPVACVDRLAIVAIPQPAQVGEVLVEVLLGSQHRAPRCFTARAVTQRAENVAPRRVSIRLQPFVVGCRTADGHRRVPGQATVVGRIAHHRPATIATARDFDNRYAMRCQFDIDLRLGWIGVIDIVAGEHQFRVGVLVIDNQQTARRIVRGI
jgi:hypothetical protein